jgi:hypothetical protein
MKFFWLLFFPFFQKSKPKSFYFASTLFWLFIRKKFNTAKIAGRVTKLLNLLFSPPPQAGKKNTGNKFGTQPK